MPEPIKRYESLQPLSREHHFNLLFAWKIREGLKHEVDVQRINRYVRWYYEKYIKPHFKEEEKIVFPILGLTNKSVRTALEHHDRISKICTSPEMNVERLSELEELITRHIRFEERTLFKELQELHSHDELTTQLQELPEIKINDNWEDEFWLG